MARFMPTVIATIADIACEGAFQSYLSLAAVNRRLGSSFHILLLQLPSQCQLLPVWAQDKAGGAAEGGGGSNVGLKLG